MSRCTSIIASLNGVAQQCLSDEPVLMDVHMTVWRNGVDDMCVKVNQKYTPRLAAGICSKNYYVNKMGIIHMKYLVAMITIETLNLICVKLFNILELNISDMDNCIA